MFSDAFSSKEPLFPLPTHISDDGRVANAFSVPDWEGLLMVNLSLGSQWTGAFWERLWKRMPAPKSGNKLCARPAAALGHVGV